MIVYTVHEPVPPAATPEARAESIQFIKEGFTWLGLFLPLPWLLLNRLWFEFIVALALVGVLSAAGMALGLPQESAGVLTLFVNLIVAFEGYNLKRWRLERKGYAFLGSVVGRDFEEVERRFFEAWYPTVSGARPLSSGVTANTPQSQPWKPAPVIGTLPGSA